MRIDLTADLRPIVEQIIKETLAAVQPSQQPTKLLWSEADTAAMLGISPYCLKAWRQAGFVESHSRRRPIVYSRAQIERIKDWMTER